MTLLGKYAITEMQGVFRDRVTYLKTEHVAETTFILASRPLTTKRGSEHRRDSFRVQGFR